MKSLWQTFFVISIVLLCPVANACGEFEADGGIGHTVDWYKGLDKVQGLIVLNPAGVTKPAELLGSPGVPKVWTADHPSVVFTIVARGFPVGGFNDQGLTMGVLLLGEDAAAFPEKNDLLKAVPPTQFVQYNLDKSATVKEVIASTKLIYPSSKLKMHYFACDATGDCVVIEYVKGEVHTYDAKKFPVLTNSFYPKSVAAFNQCGGNCDKSDNSIWRFTQLAELRQKINPRRPFAPQAFSVLDKVAQNDEIVSRFQLVYEAKKNRMNIRLPGQKDMAWLDVDFSKLKKPTKARKAILIASEVHGDLSKSWKKLTVKMQERTARYSGQTPEHAKIVSEYDFNSVKCDGELVHDN